MMVGLAAVAFGLIMLLIIKIYEVTKTPLPKGWGWLVMAAIVAIGLYLAGTRGCPYEPMV
jgi:hypothetical protein